MQLVQKTGQAYLSDMSVAELLHEIEALPSEDRLRLVEKLVHFLPQIESELERL